MKAEVSSRWILEEHALLANIQRQTRTGFRILEVGNRKVGGIFPAMARLVKSTQADPSLEEAFVQAVNRQNISLFPVIWF